MPINWITAVKLIPWSDLVQATPKLMRNAKDLWTGSRAAKEKPLPSDDIGSSAGMDAEQLQQRLVALENIQLEASALIAALAQQNAQLLDALLVQRLQLRLLALFFLLLTMASVALWLR